MSSASVQYSLSYDTLSDSTLTSKSDGPNIGRMSAVADPPVSPKNCEQSIVLPNFEHNCLSESGNKRPLQFQSEKRFKEVLIDGFSILSFHTKDDLMSYVQRFEADRPQHQLASAAEKSKRSRRIGTTSGSATCKRRTKIGLYNHNHILSGDAAVDLLPADNASENISGRVPANLPCGLQNGCLPNGVVHSSVHRTVNITTKPDSPPTTTSPTMPSEHQSMRFLKSRQSDPCSSVNHTSSDLPTRNRYSDASGSHVPVAATMHSQRASPNDHCLFSPLAGSMLSTVADCHLTPLTTTWNNHASHAAHLPSGDRWLPPKSNHSDGSLLQMSPDSASAVPTVGPGTHFVTSATSVTRPNPCHQFSVAALTKELVKQTVETSAVDPSRRPSTGVCSSVHSPTNRFFNQCQLTPRSSTDLDGPQELARLSNSSSIVRTTYEGIPLSTPTAVCSHHSTASASYVSHNNLSCQLSNGMPNLCHQTQMKLGSHQSRGCPSKMSSTPSQSVLLTNRSPSNSSPSISSPVQSRCQPSSATSKGISLSNMSTTKGSKIISSDPTTTMPSASGTEFPNSRMLQQLMGIDAHTAERLFNDIRFTELYSLTMATLAGVEAKNNTSSSKPVLSNGLADDKVAKSDDWKTLRSSICSFTSGPGSILSSTSVSKSNMNSTGSCANGHNNSGSCSVDRGSMSTVNALTRTQNLLHAAYSDRELINRITQLGHNNNNHQTHSINSRSGQLPDSVPVNPFPIFPLPTGLPPPPPLTAGCPSSESVSDAYGPMRVPPASQRDPLLRVPPPPPLYTVNQQPGHSLSNMASVNTFVPPPPLAATPQMFGPRNRTQWESYFKRTLGAIHAGEFNPTDRQDLDMHLGMPANSIYPAPTLTTRQSVVPYSALPVSTGPRPLVPSPQLAPYPHASAITTQPNRLSARFGTVEQSKRHLGALYRPYHTGRVCGRWADAHVRIANYILLQKSLNGSQRTRKSSNSGLGVSLIPKFAPIRPIVRPLSIAPPRPMVVPWSSSGPSISNCFAHTAQTKTSAVNTTSSFDPRNLTIQVPPAPLFASADRMDEKRERLLHTPQLSNSQAPSTEILEMFWQSALQKWYSQSNPPLSGHFAPPPTSSSGNALHSLGLNPVDTKQSMSQLTADRRTATESSLAAMFPPCSSLPTSFGSSLHLSLGSEAKRRRVEAPSAQHLLPPLRPELSVSHPMYSLPLLVRMPHPAELLTPGPHKQDILKATASLMNGYHIPEVFTNPHHIGLGYMNSDADRSNMLETGLKLASQSSHLATIHPW
ncbi:hypothetical protein EG68_05048 [Paragonimus skrjabini miyazakii]|uniref:Uncharacterized protein n=1 Tax=Paragonimus skrjabini miyazakii TaxID=59628 RepID=A0A8S9YBQ1_9TREM|nr:hypothetical protein EG68_05048 [Paragonimus skrjabini miyazakii]